MLNYEYPPVGGGGATVTAQLCEHLVQLGHSIDLVTMRYKDLPHEEIVNGVRIYRTPSYRARADICKIHEMATYLIGARQTALKLAQIKNYDIIHAHFIIPTSPLAKWLHKKTGISYLVTCHGSDVPGHNPQRFVLTHTIIKPLWKQLALNADILVCPSESLKNKILKQCPQADVHVIPNGIEGSVFQPGFKKNNILLCSRLLEFKGFQYVIEAVKNLELGWQVHIIGEGPYRKALEQMAQDSKTPVVFHGWLDRNGPKFKKLYETSAIFVFPSEMENFPTVLLEAMSAGCAVITSTAGGCPEVVGDAGLLIAPKDTDAIQEKIHLLVNNQNIREKMANNAIQQAHQFSWPNIAKQYLQLYQSLIK